MPTGTLVMGLFVETADAERALGGLMAAGFRREEISALAADRRAQAELGIEKHSKVGAGAAIGAGFGGAVGALLAGFTAIGAITTGGVALVAAGPLVAALAGAGAGAAAGGVVGGLTGLGIPEHEVKFYRESLEKGAVLIGVRCENERADDVRGIFKSSSASRITTQTVQLDSAPGPVPHNDKTATQPAAAASIPTGMGISADEWSRESPLKRLFIDQLRDIYYAEHELLEALRQFESTASSPELAQAFHEHRDQTHEHIRRLDSVFQMIGVRAEKKRCPAITGILAEARELLALDETYPQRDAAIVCAAQKAEHYEIGTYGCLRTYARTLGLTGPAGLLERTLAEEWDADHKLTALAESGINQLATVGAA